MVSLKTVLATGAALLATVSAAPAASVEFVERASTPCGVEPTPGIRKPANGTTILYTTKEQKNFEGTTFQIIYCSGDYFKTSSLNATALLRSGSSGGAGQSGMILGSARPSGAAAPAGYYGYIFNVTVYPLNGNYITGPQQLSVFEFETGYYNPNNYQLHSVTINLQKAKTNSTCKQP